MNTAQHNAAGAKDNNAVKSGEGHFIAVVPGKKGDKTEAEYLYPIERQHWDEC